MRGIVTLGACRHRRHPLIRHEDQNSDASYTTFHSRLSSRARNVEALYAERGVTVSLWRAVLVVSRLSDW